jgi:hypothetical protein
MQRALATLFELENRIRERTLDLHTAKSSEDIDQCKRGLRYLENCRQNAQSHIRELQDWKQSDKVSIIVDASVVDQLQAINTQLAVLIEKGKTLHHAFYNEAKPLRDSVTRLVDVVNDGVMVDCHPYLAQDLCLCETCQAKKKEKVNTVVF